MILLLVGAPSSERSAVARLLAARTGFTYHPLGATDPAESDGLSRREAVESLRRRAGRGRHLVVEDRSSTEDLRKFCEAARVRLFLVRLRVHDAEVRHTALSVPREGRAPLWVSHRRLLHVDRPHKRGHEVDLELHTTGKDPSECVWWVLSSGQFLAAVGDEGIEITVADPPAEDPVLRENLARNAGSQLLHECLYCSNAYLREHMVRLESVRYLMDGVSCHPWSCQWCWGGEAQGGGTQDEALAQAEEAEVLFSEGGERLRRGDAEGAVRAYLRATEFAPSADLLYAALAAAFAATDQNAKARAEIARAVRLCPTHVLHRHLLATLLEEDGKLAEAAREWRAVLRLARRARLLPSDFARVDLGPVVADATEAISRLAAFGTEATEEEEEYSDCERSVLRAEEHFGREQWREAIQCLETAREMAVQAGKPGTHAQLLQRINRLMGDCYRRMQGPGRGERGGDGRKGKRGKRRAPRDDERA